MVQFMASFITVLLYAVLMRCDQANKPMKPNIVFILMDDLGWNDVSFNNGQFPTTNMDELHQNSIELTRHYIHLMCSPSRTQFLTGRYAMHQGIGKMLPWDYTEIGGIPIGQPTIANWLKVTGDYTTYAVGKWHCGYAYDALLPTSKGFDHFFGFYQGAIHYDNMQYIDIKFGDSDHYDFWEDSNEFVYKPQDEQNDLQLNTMYLYRDKIVEYIEDEANKERQTPFYMYIPLQTIHGPLNRVHEYEEECDKILGGNIARRSKYCQNMLLTDDVIGTIMASLKDNGLWKHTLFILTTDNGADIANKGCNFPLRGTKGTQFDGNTRVIALIGGGFIPKQEYKTSRDVLFSSLDWTPTLLHFSGGLNEIKAEDYTWDGIDQYDLIMYNDDNVQRDDIVFNIGLRNLESATIVFKYSDDHLYKYIAQDVSVDQWAYKREDGWCIPDKDGNWNMIMDGDVSLAKHVDNKYLFDLTMDVSEKINLLQYDDNNNIELINYAKQILSGYIDDPLYSEHLPFLWTRLPSGDPSLQGPGSFVAPFLSEDEYFYQLEKGFNRLEPPKQSIDDETIILPFTGQLKTIYFNNWEVPQYILDNSTKKSSSSSSISNMYLYAIGITLCIAFILAIKRCRYIEKTRFYKDGYEAIKQVDGDQLC